MSKYINSYTDFGFKNLFGEESGNDLLIAFQDSLLQPDEHKRYEIIYLFIGRINRYMRRR